jgi:hypothetical protein
MTDDELSEFAEMLAYFWTPEMRHQGYCPLGATFPGLGKRPRAGQLSMLPCIFAMGFIAGFEAEHGMWPATSYNLGKLFREQALGGSLEMYP